MSQSVRSFVDTTEIQIGMPIHLYIEIQKHRPSDFFEFSPLSAQDSLKDNFEILSVSYDTLQLNNTSIFQQKIGFTAWEKGSYTLQPVWVTINGDSIATKIVNIQVDEPMAKEEINEIKDIVTEEVSPLSFINLFLGIFIFYTAIGFILYFVNERRYSNQKQANFQPKNFEGWKSLTLNKLHQLQSSQLIEKGKVKEFYSQYSDIVKGFLHERYKIPAKELFTSDLIHLIENRHYLPEEDTRKLKTLLRRADLAKFAKIVPSKEQADQDIHEAIQIVEKTPNQSISES